MLEDAAFNGKEINNEEAESPIHRAEELPEEID